jgi:hypothetical protein
MHSLQPLRNTWLIAIMLLAAWLIPTQPARAGFLDPNAFTSLGAFPTQMGEYQIVTGTGQSAPTMMLPDGTIIQGVVSNGFAVFTFDSVNVQTGMFLDADGMLKEQSGPGNPLSLGFALLSKSSLTVAPSLFPQGDVINAVPSAQYLGAGGGQGGFGVGLGGNVTGGTGKDPGASGTAAGGGGGGNGGAGGAGGGPFGPFNVPGIGGASGGGVGSGGGGARGGSFFAGGNGGSGGGLIDLGALGAVNISGRVDVSGYQATNGMAGGGGGSGGTLLISGNSVTLTGGLLANGGNGGNGELQVPQNSAYSGGGGGGGGVIEIEAGPGGFLNSGTMSVAGGTGGLGVNNGTVMSAPGFDGGAGVVNIFEVVPEPASVVLMGAGAVLLGLAGLRRRSQTRG